MAIHPISFARRTAAACPVDRQTVQPFTAGAWQGCRVRFEVAEQRGLVWNGYTAFMGSSRVFGSGVKRRKESKSGQVYYEIEYDTANQRHWIDKFKADAAKQLDVRDKTLEDFLDEIAAEKADG